MQTLFEPKETQLGSRFESVGTFATEGVVLDIVVVVVVVVGGVTGVGTGTGAGGVTTIRVHI